MATEEEFRTLGKILRAFLEGVLGEEAARVKADPFPAAGIDAFTSHFDFTVRFGEGPFANQPVSVTMPSAIQTVARSEPFTYRGSGAGHKVETPLPNGCTLSPTITEADFVERPDEFFVEGKEVVWMQILNLDARGETPFGTVRIILGETLKREYPDLFQPSLGVAQSVGKSGFPASLFFDPTAVMETPLGAFRAVHGILAYGRVQEFPPVGTPVTIRKLIPLHEVEALRAVNGIEARAAVAAEVIALAHPIDSQVQLSPEEAFGLVEQSIRFKESASG
jgi:hypothetical protein